MNKYLYSIGKRITSFLSVISLKHTNHKLYKLDKVKSYFKNSPSNYNDEKVFYEMSQYYIKASQEQLNKSYNYKVGNEWEPIFHNNMSYIQKILLESNTHAISSVYNNFFRENHSTGLHGDSSIKRMKKRFFQKDITYFNKKLYLKQCIFYYELWRELIVKITKLDEDNLQTKPIGNEYLFPFNNNLINPNNFKNHYYACLSIFYLSNERKKDYIFELGGGYGSYAYYVSLVGGYKYIGCDLPENISLTYFYLKSLLPKKKIILISNFEELKNDLIEYDIILISNYDIEKLPKNIAVLSFNSYSLAEMHREAIDNYIKHIVRITKKYFLHINHTRYLKYKLNDNELKKNKFELISKKFSRWNMCTNIFSDEYEFLYKKKES